MTKDTMGALGASLTYGKFGVRPSESDQMSSGVASSASHRGPVPGRLRGAPLPRGGGGGGGSGGEWMMRSHCWLRSCLMVRRVGKAE